MRIVDPTQVYDAISAITAGFFAVIAAVKLKFARTIALGTAAGETFERAAQKYVLAHLESRLSTDYRKWAKPVLSYSIKLSKHLFKHFRQDGEQLNWLIETLKRKKV